jgi:hypothetical protein
MERKDIFRDLRIVVGWHGLRGLTEIELQDMSEAEARLSQIQGDEVAKTIAQMGRGQSGLPLAMPRLSGDVIARRAGEERESRKDRK